MSFAGGVNFSHAYRIASNQKRRGGFSKQKAIDEGWRDTHIELRGTAAKELERLFRDTWSRAQCSGELPQWSDQAVRGGNTLVQIVPSTPEDKVNVIYATMLSVITYAQRSIDITMAYFVPDDVFENALKDAARRGVKVRLILPAYSDFSGVFYAGRAHYDELLESGVRDLRARDGVSAFEEHRGRRRVVLDRLDQLRLAQLRPQRRDQRVCDR